MSAPRPTTDMLSQLSNVLPTGTFLVFQVLAPLATNNGDCGRVEIVLTSITLILLCLLCIASSFSDNFTATNGVVYYGIVTPWGLWNPNFRRVVVADNPSSYFRGPEDKYVLELDDFVAAAISVVALATISLLTAPVTTCFYPNISDSILKTTPILVGLVVAAVCAFGTTPRNGIGFAPTPPRTATTTTPPPVAAAPPRTATTTTPPPVTAAPPHATTSDSSPPRHLDQQRNNQQV